MNPMVGRRTRIAVALWGTSLLAGTLGCSDPVLEPVQLPPDNIDECLVRGPGHGDAFRSSCIGLTWDRSVDLLFVIDDSTSTAAVQARLAEAMDTLVAEVAALELQPDLRVGFAGVHSGFAGCGTAPRGLSPVSSCRERASDFVDTAGNDAFASACEAVCGLDELGVVPTTLPLGDTGEVRPWIDHGPSGSNLRAGTDLAQALRCAAPQGVRGCGYGAVLDSLDQVILRSEDEADAGEGFFRPGAGTVVVMVTNEVDCSVAEDQQTIFDPGGTRGLWSDPTAEAPTPAVCWNGGTACTPEEGPVYDGCEPADVGRGGQAVDPGEGVLTEVDEHVDLLEELARQQERITPDHRSFLLTLAGVPVDPEAAPVYADAEDPAAQLQWGIGPGCEGPGVSALPPVRLRAFTESQRDGALMSVCADDYAPAMQWVAQAVGEHLRPTCMPACVGDDDPETEGLQVDCRIEREVALADGTFDSSFVAACQGTTEAPLLPAGEELCWFPRTGDQRSTVCAEEGWNLEVGLHWEGTRPPITHLLPLCTLSQDKAADCPDLP